MITQAPSGQTIEIEVTLESEQVVVVSATDYIWNHFQTCHQLSHEELAEIIAHNCFCLQEDRTRNEVVIHPDLGREHGGFTVNGESKTIAIYGLMPVSISS